MDISFLGLQTGVMGLQAAQQAIDTTGENISNASTAGYTREGIDQSARAAYNAPLGFNTPVAAGILGAGVDVTQITRFRNQFLDTQYWRENSTLGNQSALRDNLKQIEAVVNEPSDHGVSSLFSKFWSDWQEVSLNPENQGVRTALLSDSQGLAGAIRQVYQDLQGQQSDVDNTIKANVVDINNTLTAIAADNDQISQAQAVGQQANAILDDRGAKLEHLSKLLNVQTNTDSSGRMNVYVDGHALINGKTAYPMGTVTNASGFTDVVMLDNTTFSSNAAPPAVNASYLGGQMAALFKVRDNVIGQPLFAVPAGTGLLSQLDQLANQVAAQVNGLQSTGVDLTGAVNARPFFVNSVGTTVNIGAGNLNVNAALTANPSLIAAASPPAGPKPGDGSNALKISRLSENPALIVSGGNFSQDGYLRSIVTSLGTQTQTAEVAASNQTGILQHLDSLRQSNSGVSLDEEMSNLIKYQHAYGAAAKLVSTVDSMLGTLIDGLKASP